MASPGKGMRKVAKLPGSSSSEVVPAMAVALPTPATSAASPDSGL